MALSVGQWQIGAVIIGTPNVALVDVDGLGWPEPKNRDVDLDMSGGVVFGPDLAATRLIGLTVQIRADLNAADRAVDAMNRARTVLNAWVPAGTQTLYGNMPGWGSMSFSGRCRGADTGLSHMASGLIDLHLSFVARDSTIGSLAP